MKRCISLIMVLVLSFTFILNVGYVFAEQKVKGRVVKIVPEEKMVIIEDKSGQRWTIYFEEERVFRRFKRLKIMKGDKVLIRYKEKGGRIIGTYVRSLMGC